MSGKFVLPPPPMPYYQYDVSGYESDDSDDDDYFNDFDYRAQHSQAVRNVMEQGKNFFFEKFKLMDSFVEPPVHHAETIMSTFSAVEEKQVNLLEPSIVKANLDKFVDHLHYVDDNIKALHLEDVKMSRELGTLPKEIVPNEPGSPGFLFKVNELRTKFNLMNFKIDFNVIISMLKNEQDHPLLNIIKYDDTKTKVLIKDFDEMRIVYIPSGGGKTTLVSKYPGIYYDVDQFIKDNLVSFQDYRSFINPYDDNNLMMLWFKYTFHHTYKNFRNKILLFNHPNQIPNCFRLGYNEMIILPRRFNFGLRFFNENVFSLAAVHFKHCVLLDYDDYHNYIKIYFINQGYEFNECYSIHYSMNHINQILPIFKSRKLNY